MSETHLKPNATAVVFPANSELNRALITQGAVAV